MNNIDPVSVIVYVVVLLFSVIIHEISHGFVAGWFGDDTAKEAGRLTLNPISHIDPVMSILLPLILAVSHLPVFGAAKPVPINYNRMDNPKLGLALVSLAGPISNFALAIIATLLYFVGVPNLVPGSEIVLIVIIQTNVLLGVFNFIPIPPLDGSRIIAALLPEHLMELFLSLDRFGFIFVMILIFSGLLDPILFGAMNILYRILGLT
jgi:Zn-dependent protease